MENTLKIHSFGNLRTMLFDKPLIIFKLLNQGKGAG